MNGFKILGALMLAAPAIATAQVGPNPAAPGGSQSPTIGTTSDPITAPQDARVGARATGQVLDRSTTRTDTTTTGAGMGTSVGIATDTDASATGTGTSVGTETRTKTRTRSMERRR